MALDKYLPSLLALGVAVVTGFFTVLSAYLANRASTRQLSLKLRHESEKDRLEARRERLEELYSLVMAWSKQAASFYFPFLVYRPGNKCYNKECLPRVVFPWQLVARCSRWFSATTRFSNSRASPTQGRCPMRSCSGRRSCWLAQPAKPTQPSPNGWA